MAREFYTYVHTKPDGTPFYVGKGCRSTSDRATAFNRRSQYHKNIVAKYGRENIGVYVFLCDSERQAFDDEIHQIAQLRAEGYELANHSDGGEGPSGAKWSDEARRRRGDQRRGRRHSEETKRKIALGNSGKVFDAARLAAMSAGARAAHARRRAV